MPKGFIQIKPTDILQLEALAPVYQNKYNGFIYVTKEQRNKPGIYDGISNRKINAMIKEGYAIKEKDGAVVRSAKGTPLISNPQSAAIQPAIQSELEELRQIAVRYTALRDKLFELLEDL